ILGLKCEHCYKYLDKSIDELTKSYNQKLQLEEIQLELNNEKKVENDCELEETDSYILNTKTDFELQQRILDMLFK
ncbi:7766_t:CDS:1, partial [Funneliformis geosporum]